jgi:hypothetical protein
MMHLPLDIIGAIAEFHIERPYELKLFLSLSHDVRELMSRFIPPFFVKYVPGAYKECNMRLRIDFTDSPYILSSDMPKLSKVAIEVVVKDSQLGREHIFGAAQSVDMLMPLSSCIYGIEHITKDNVFRPKSHFPSASSLKFIKRSEGNIVCEVAGSCDKVYVAKTIIGKLTEIFELDHDLNNETRIYAHYDEQRRLIMEDTIDDRVLEFRGVSASYITTSIDSFPRASNLQTLILKHVDIDFGLIPRHVHTLSLVNVCCTKKETIGDEFTNLRELNIRCAHQIKYIQHSVCARIEKLSLEFADFEIMRPDTKNMSRQDIYYVLDCPTPTLFPNLRSFTTNNNIIGEIPLFPKLRSLIIYWGHDATVLPQRYADMLDRLELYSCIEISATIKKRRFGNRLIVDACRNITVLDE